MRNFWKGKRVLITGDQGFVGSHLAKALINKGAEVTGFDIKVNDMDVSNYDLVEKTIREKKIQVVYHLAAEAIVERAGRMPLQAFLANILGTWNIIELCRTTKGIKSVIFASSDKAYGEHKILPYKENYPLLTKYPYEVSKSCADLLAQSYFFSYRLPIVITRCGNIYGCGDPNTNRLLPNAIRCLLNCKELLVRGSGKFVRDFIYIDDIVDAYIRIGELFKRRKLAGQVFNLGNNQPISILDFVKTINEVVRGGLRYRLIDGGFGEIQKQYLDSSKAYKLLGWKPKWSLKEGLIFTLQEAFKNGAYR